MMCADVTYVYDDVTYVYDDVTERGTPRPRAPVTRAGMSTHIHLLVNAHTPFSQRTYTF